MKKKSRRERPIGWGYPYPPADPQELLPAGWCVRCGTELFKAKRELCQRCKRAERRHAYERRKTSQPLPVLYRGC